MRRDCLPVQEPYGFAASPVTAIMLITQYVRDQLHHAPHKRIDNHLLGDNRPLRLIELSASKELIIKYDIYPLY